jgi:DNA repair exonuclease SbcCD nuclease subunit
MKVGWLSDTHLGFFQYGMVRRKKDFFLAFKNAVQDMIDQKVDGIIHTGDLLHSNRPGPDTIRDELMVIDRMLETAGIKMLVITGNHDAAKPAWTSVLSGNGIVCVDNAYHTFKRAIPGAGVEGNHGNEELRILGLPQMNREELLQRLGEESMQLRSAEVIMLHQSISDFTGFETASSVKIDDLPQADQTLIAIGDTHVFSWKDRGRDRYVASIGSTEMNSESEHPEKWWMELNFDQGFLASYQRHLIKTRPVVRISIKTEADISHGIEKALEGTPKDEEDQQEYPLVFIRHRTDVPNVVPRMLGALRPDRFIVRFHPEYVNAKAAGGVTVEDEQKQMTPEDLLKTIIPAEDPLYVLASQLINPEINAKPCLEEFVQSRLAAIGKIAS